MLTDSLTNIILYIIYFIVSSVVEILSLWGLSKVLKFKKQDLKPAVMVSITSSLLSLVLGITLDILGINTMDMMIVILYLALQFVLFIIYFLLIKKFYGEGWGKTLLIGFGVIAIMILVAIVLIILLFAVAVLLGISMQGSGMN
jgi:hypothetical protein